MGILEVVRKDENARKIFGEKELKIIERQLLGISLTQSEKNRLSRDIRRKLEFIGKLARFQDEFELKKGAEIKRKIEEALNVIKEHELFRKEKVRRIVLFGSVVENKLTFRSDIDISVEFDKISLKEATKFRIHVSGRVSDKIDIQVYNVLPKKIRKEIDNKGRVLYER